MPCLHGESFQKSLCLLSGFLEREEIERVGLPRTTVTFLRQRVCESGFPDKVRQRRGNLAGKGSPSSSCTEFRGAVGTW